MIGRQLHLQKFKWLMTPTIVEKAWSQFLLKYGSVQISLVIALEPDIGVSGMIRLVKVVYVAITKHCMVASKPHHCLLFKHQDFKIELFVDRGLTWKLTL